MFDAMKSALKNHMGKSKLGMGGPKPPSAPNEADKSPDKAPELGDVPHGTMMAESPADEAHEQDMQSQILHALMSLKGEHPGRGPLGLSEVASDKAKEKFASINKHKGDAKY